jgi:hypothetical protein
LPYGKIEERKAPASNFHGEMATVRRPSESLRGRYGGG